MRESKMYHLSFALERKRNSKDTKDGLYMPEVRKGFKVKRFCNKVIFLIFKILVSTAITFPCAIWAIEYAYIERGYKAYGGEYLFIAMVFYITFSLLGVFLRD